MKKLERQHLDLIVKKSSFFNKKRLYFQNKQDFKDFNKITLIKEIQNFVLIILLFLVYLLILKFSINIIPINLQLIFAMIMVIVWVLSINFLAKQIFYQTYLGYEVSDSLYQSLEDEIN